ncbi:putative transcriptional regulatory protein [Fusarium oxysporum f. sp. cubense]|uniref:Putative transcriptional regulatory protein C16G5.16 n=2 Tax=Fusarium oxysporum f. sp. cubense TaxID=61366 RepID=N4TRY1_FUSC1|nr:Putative transcriptional regulatory protein C16G5.16 [Fusarium oxysporum f. sp. cubense race 1]TVY74977.1 putative transcriptional regulatory protein [Fusarium oxysporum f. sp. cubense]
MISGNLPDPPAEEPKLTFCLNSTSASIKPIQPVRRNSKRACQSAAKVHQDRHRATHTTGMEGRNKRMQKACEQCRMRKSKCDTGFPCSQCKDYGLICTGGVPTTSKCKHLPKGYAEVLKNTQSALVMTIRTLYFKVRNNQSWDLGEPELDHHGQPVIHSIVQKLGCIHPNNEIDLSEYSLFPEDEVCMDEFAQQLRNQQIEHKPRKEPMKDENPSMWNRTERASPSKLYHFNVEHDYQKATFGNIDINALSPQNVISSAGFNFPSLPPEADSSTLLQSPAMSNFDAWQMAKPQPTDLNLPFFQQRSGMMANMNLLNQGHVGFEVDTIKSHVHLHTSPEVILDIDDSMLSSGYAG